MILYGVDVRGGVVGGGGRYDVSPVGDIGFCESVPCVFFKQKKTVSYYCFLVGKSIIWFPLSFDAAHTVCDRSGGRDAKSNKNSRVTFLAKKN